MVPPSALTPEGPGGHLSKAEPASATGLPGFPADVVLPIYGAPELLGRCLASYQETLDPLSSSRLILVVDGPQDPQVEAQIQSYQEAARGPLEVLRNRRRRGFVVSANRGMAASAQDVVLLNSDTEVTPRWLAKMQQAAASDLRAATVTPFSNNATICSLPHPGVAHRLPQGLDANALAALVEEAAEPRYPEIPTGVGFCLLIRRAALDEVGALDEAFGLGYGEDSDFCWRARQAGWRHLLDDTTFVFHTGEGSFGPERAKRVRRAESLLHRRYPLYEPTIAAFLDRDPLEPLRRRVLKALPEGALSEVERHRLLPPWSGDAEPQAARGLKLVAEAWVSEGPRAFFHRVAARKREHARRKAFSILPESSLEDLRAPLLHLAAMPPDPRLGGVEAQTAARLDVEARHRAVALLYPEALESPGGAGSRERRFRLELREGSRAQVVVLRSSAQDEAPTLSREPAWERAVNLALQALDVQAVQVENPTGLPLESLRELVEPQGQAQQPELILSMHDFWLAPPAPVQPCGACRDYPGSTCCLRCGGPGLREARPEPRTMAALLRAAAALVFPSEPLWRRYREAWPDLECLEEARIIAPGIAEATLPPQQAPSPGHRKGPPRVAFLGGPATHKGFLIFEDLLERWRRSPRRLPTPHWFVYGGGSAGTLRRLRRIRRLPGVTVRGFYPPGSLPTRLRQDRIDLVLMLPAVEESFSLALSECAAAGVPVLALESGALGERLRAAGVPVVPVARNAVRLEELPGEGLLEALEAALQGFGARQTLPAAQPSPVLPAVPTPLPTSHAATAVAAAAGYRQLYQDLAIDLGSPAPDLQDPVRARRL